MKNLIKQIGIIAFVAIIGFSFAALSLTGCGGGEDPPVVPPVVPPAAAHYDAIELRANRWNNADGSAEEWSNSEAVKLSDFTAVKPKQGDVLRFKISGVSDAALNDFQISLCNHNSDWTEYKWLGASDFIELSTNFSDIIFDITVLIAPAANAPVYLNLVNVLWQKNANGEYTHDSGMRLGATPKDTVMATITNFSISLSGNGSDEEEEIPDGNTDNGGKPPIDGSVQGNTLMAQLEWLKDNVQSNKDYTLTARADETISTLQSLEYAGKSNITVTIKGIDGEKIITCYNFNIGSGITMVLDENITFQAHPYFKPLFIIYEGGTLVMNANAKIISSMNQCVSLIGGTLVMNADTKIICELATANNQCVGISKGGTFTMNGGTISGGSFGVEETGNSTFIMNGGTISDNHVGVYLTNDKDSANAIFTMNGGTISGNTSSGGVIVYDGTIFTMNGGTISGNTGENGGGVRVNLGTFTMNGGIISGNISNAGGGVGVIGGKFTMNGGEISGNTAGMGGGVFLESFVGHTATFRISNGIVYGSDADADKANVSTNSYGASLYDHNVGIGIAQYGTNTWTNILPFNQPLMNTTIKVVNGALQ